MRLSRVKIFGFKTFADKTEFILRGGTIAIVGPNGCGKSNLVDAILWGLGEGNAKQLRTQTGQDVIFGGSSKRKALGFAEVALLFDNEDGSLPIQSSECEITRRLTRNGDSEYRINGRTCRLKDIHELLADSGLGRAGYSIVGQKEIDQALAASPEDRRSWIDEAAGVQRYRARKVEAQRRLASAQLHLQRVADILGEIELQIGPLEGEAEVAKKYKAIIGTLQEIESGLLVVELCRAHRAVLTATTMAAQAQELSETESQLADILESESRKLQETTKRITLEAEAVRDQLSAASSAIQEAETKQRLAAQRLESLDEIEGSLFEDGEAAEKRIAIARQEAKDAESEAATELDALEKLRVESAGSGSEAQLLKDKLNALDGQLVQARHQLTEQLRREAEFAHAESRRKEIGRELKGIDATLPDLKRGVQEALVITEAVNQRVVAQSERINGLITQLSDLKKLDAERETQSRQLGAQLASMEARRAAIEATIDSLEGFSQGTRAVLALCQSGQLRGSYVPISQAITVDAAHAVAIEIALGPHSNDLIVNGSVEAKAAIEVLKEQRLGRATFQPIDLVRPDLGPPELRNVLNERGVLGRASELIHCDNRYRPVLDALLGRVLIVTDLDQALRLAKTTGWNRLITLEGEVIHHKGAVTGGDSGKPQFGMIQRRSEIAQIDSDIKALDIKLQKLNAEGNRVVDTKSQLEVQIEAAQTALLEIRDEAEEARSWSRQLESELTDTERSRQRLLDERERLGGNLEAAELVDLPALEKARDDVLRELASRTADAEAAESRLREAEARVQQAQLRAELARRRLTAAMEGETYRNKRAESIEPERKKLNAEMERAERAMAAAIVAKDQAEAELEALQTKRESTHQVAMGKLDQARSARFASQVATEALHKAELDRARADAKRGASAQRLLEDYGINEEMAFSLEAETVVPEDAAVVVPRLRRELKALGDVNVGAIEAYDRLSQRHQELSHQREDILAGIADVEASVAELDKLTSDRFQTTFELVRVSFRNLFSRLFEGGSGDIRMADESKLLDSGIDIEVTLPGKKRQRLELLSGGERSLCATAFLFALLDVKPSPLVVLDEVDAPLDGRNVERFVGLLQDFSTRVQFIVVTHNDITIKSTSTWIGVTMAEPGVSTLVPVVLPDEPAQLQATHA